MIAGIVKKNGLIECDTMPTPKLEDDSVKIKVAVTGICGSDIPRVWKNGAHNYPIVLGHEFSGTISEVGKDVKNLKIGDHVVGVPLVPCFKCEDCQNGNFSLCKNYSFVGSRQQGSMAEYIVLKESNVFKISKDIPLEKAAFFEPSTIALHAINLVNYQNNKNVVILGGGNIGSFMVQWAKILGANKIVVIGRNKEKLKRSIDLGATHVVSTLDDDYLVQLNSLTQGRGFDYVFETAGSTILMQLAFQLVKNKGDVCLVGTPTTDLFFTPKLWELLNRKEFKLTGSWMSYSNPWPGVEWQETAKRFNEKTLNVTDDMIYGRYPLEKISDAFDLYKDDKHPGGKVLIYSDKELLKRNK